MVMRALDRAMWQLREPVLAGALSASEGGTLRAAMKTATGPAVLAGGSSMSSVLLEAMTWMMLPPHPDVVDILHAEMVDGDCILFAELVEGADLDHTLAVDGQWGRLAEAPHASEERRTLMRLSLAHQMARGLNHLHASHLAHFDVKPANVMLAIARSEGDATSIPDAKVCDFGLAKRASPSEPVRLSGGTIFYLGHKGRDAKTSYSACDDTSHLHAEMPTCASHDGFALAITILEMWGGGCAYSNSATDGCLPKWLIPFFPAGEKGKRPASDAVNSLPEQAPPMPEPLAMALSSMLAPSWLHRPANLSTLIEAIEASAPGGRASLVLPDNEALLSDEHFAVTTTYATIMRGLALSELALSNFDDDSDHGTLEAARHLLETGLAELEELARGDDAALTPEGEADDNAHAHALQEALLGPVHRRLGHVLITLSEQPRQSLVDSIIQLQRILGAPADFDWRAALGGRRLGQLQSAWMGALDAERLVEAIVHFRKAAALVDDLSDDEEEDRIALVHAIEHLASSTNLTLSQARRALPQSYLGDDEHAADMVDLLLPMVAARSQLTAWAAALNQQAAISKLRSGTPADEGDDSADAAAASEPLANGQLVVLREHSCARLPAAGRSRAHRVQATPRVQAAARALPDGLVHAVPPHRPRTRAKRFELQDASKGDGGLPRRLRSRFQ